MPRGIPNAKRDENSMRFTSFHVPLPPNPKHMGSTYLKSESQTLWHRNAKGKGIAEDATSIEVRRGSKVLVIHPGSRWLRVGRASDVTPITVPNVIARKHESPVPPPNFVGDISRPRKGRERGQPSVVATPGDEYGLALASDDPFDSNVAAITISLRDRMRFYKLRVTPNAASIASTFNEQFKPEIIPEENDPYRVNWIDSSEGEFLVGEKVLRLSDPEKQGYVVRWPLYGAAFNTRDYSSNALVLGDIETILRSTLKEKFDIDERAYKEYSVVLVIPDFYDRFYMEAMVRTLLTTMGFRQLCAQQESLAATYGAGISNACVVDMGSVTTSIACVDDGLVIADSRMSLSMGGDDITEFLYVLLQKISFPYRDINLVRSYDWSVMEDLKARLCTLTEADVALNLYDFVVRRPGKATEKYGLRAYDEIILAPMCLFEPRVIEFDNKRKGMRPTSSPDVTDEIVEQTSDHVTQAMMISTQHLLPSAIPNPVTSHPELSSSLPTSGPQTPGINGASSSAALAQPSESSITTPIAAVASTGDGVGNTTSTETSAVPEGSDDAPETSEQKAEETPSEGPPMDDLPISDIRTEIPALIDTPAATASAATAALTLVGVTGDGTADAPMEILDIEDTGGGKSATTVLPTPSDEQIPHIVQPPVPPAPVQTYPGGFAIDVCFEASKLPLDVAIFNSARAAGGDEKIRKYLQAVLVIGGTALVPGMAHALESRLQAIATPLVPNMEKVQIIPPPKDVDPRILSWKGAAVLGKMDGVADLWITAQDWDYFGLRGLKERCFYL